MSPRCFRKLISALRREGADPQRQGRPWRLPLENRVLLVTTYWRTNLTLRQLAPLFGISKSAAACIIDHLGPWLSLRPTRRFRKDTALIVDGTLGRGGWWKEEHNRSHKQVRAPVEHTFARMKGWRKILRDCRLRSDGIQLRHARHRPPAPPLPHRVSEQAAPQCCLAQRLTDHC